MFVAENILYWFMAIVFMVVVIGELAIKIRGSHGRTSMHK